MHSPFRPFLVLSAALSLASCDKPTPPAAEVIPDVPRATAATETQLAEARDALQRQALEIETKTALMDKQLADMEQALKERENDELRSSLDALKRQNDELRVQADVARRQSNAITQRIATPSPRPVLPRDYSLFYDRLAPLGRWLDVKGYGYCWRPTITVSGWRPYVDGCWVWSSLGWAWQSNEPFGWATYHYGRWVNLSRYGWVWAPGSEWAPAWVAWRQSRDCVGWAPLPPEPGICSGVYRDCDSRYGLGPTSYTFINSNQFVRSSYTKVYAPVTQQTTIFQHSVNVTQIVPSSGHGHAFVHQGGPPRAQMEQACGQPVPQRQVQTMQADQMPAQHHQHGHAGAAPQVAMVELPAATTAVPPRHPEIKEHVQKPARVSGFEGVPQRVATEIRENIAREKETAVVQQQPVHERMPHESPRRSVEAPAVVNVAPVLNAPVQETIATNTENPAAAEPATGVAMQKENGIAAAPESHGRPRRGEAKNAEPVVVPAPVVEPDRAPPAVVVAPQPSMPEAPAAQQSVAAETEVADPAIANAAAAEKARLLAAEEQAQAAAMEERRQKRAEAHAQAEKMAADQGAVAAETENSRMQTAAAVQQQEAQAAQQQRMVADQAAAETEKARQQEADAKAQAEKTAAEQAAAAADAEKARMQAAAAQQQEAQAAQQQQQEQAAQQQRAAAERMAAEQEQAAAGAARAQQAEAAAMQRQQEESIRRAAEEQQMRAQQEAERRAQEREQRQAEEQARRQQEAEAQRAQEMAQRRAEEQARRQQEAEAQRAQEMAQRQAEERARRQQEAEMQRAQEQAQRQAEEQARRAAEEQMRAQQEAAQRAAQEQAQRQAEEAARRAQEEAQRAAAEAAQQAAAAAAAAAAEAARNQPAPPGS